MSGTDPCRGAESMLQPYLDRVLTESEAARVDEHLRDCEYCRERYVFERGLRTAVKRCCSDEPVPAGLVERLRRRCADQA
jgi:anti-sigma factor (TIGR02949 family)